MEHVTTQKLLKLYEFQSLIGLKINWNGLIPMDRSNTKLFQSLIGLKINWNGFEEFFKVFFKSFNP